MSSFLAQSHGRQPPPRGAGRPVLGLCVQGPREGGGGPEKQISLEKKLPGLSIMGRGLAPSPTQHRYPPGVQLLKEESGLSRHLWPRDRSHGLRTPSAATPYASLPTCGDRALDSSGRLPGSENRRVSNFPAGAAWHRHRGVPAGASTRRGPG